MKLRSLFGIPRMLMLLVGGFLLWQVWVFTRPSPRVLNAAETNAAEAACRNLITLVDPHLDGPTRFGVAHLVNDPRGAVSSLLRDSLTKQGDWRVEEGSIIGKFLSDVSKAVVEATTLEEIVNAGQSVGLDVVVTGKVESVELAGEGATADINFQVYDMRAGKWLHRGPLRGAWQPGVLEKSLDSAVGTNPFVRLLVWVGLVALLPWLTAFAIHATLEKKSNLSSFVLLTIYTAVDLVLGFLIAGLSLSGTAGGIVLIVGFVACTSYNYWACERIAAK